MKCPKCGYQRTEADQDKPKNTCPSCGVIYSKVQAAPGPEPVSIQPQPTNTSTKPKKEITPVQPNPKVSSCLGYFLFITLGIPGLFIFGGGIEEGVWGHLGQTILGFILFAGTFVTLPPVQKHLEKVGTIIGFGLVGLVGVFCVVFLKSCFAPLPVDIENGIAKREIIVSPLYTVGVVADNINDEACTIIEENKNIKGVELTVYIDGESVSDKYGNNAGANMYMGSVEVSDLEEVRKYKTCSDYSYAMKPKTMAKVLSMRNSYLLRR